MWLFVSSCVCVIWLCILKALEERYHGYVCIGNGCCEGCFAAVASDFIKGVCGLICVHIIVVGLVKEFFVRCRRSIV